MQRAEPERTYPTHGSSYLKFRFYFQRARIHSTVVSSIHGCISTESKNTKLLQEQISCYQEGEESNFIVVLLSTASYFPGGAPGDDDRGEESGGGGGGPGSMLVRASSRFPSRRKKYQSVDGFNRRDALAGKTLFNFFFL